MGSDQIGSLISGDSGDDSPDKSPGTERIAGDIDAEVVCQAGARKRKGAKGNGDNKSEHDEALGVGIEGAVPGLEAGDVGEEQ